MVVIFFLSENPCLVMNFSNRSLLVTKVSHTAGSLFPTSNNFFDLDMIIFLLTWSILARCSYTQATNLCSRSESKNFRPPPSTRCLLDFVEMIFSKIAFHFLTRVSSALDFNTVDQLLFSIAIEKCFLNSIVNSLLFCPSCDMKSFLLFSVVMLFTHLETKLTLV